MRLSIVCPSGYPVLAPGSIPFAGGAEFQLLMLARAMRTRGHEVHWIVGDYGQPEFCELDGFPVHRAFALAKGNRKLRFLPDMWKLRSALRKTRPDVVNQRSTSFYTGQCCAFAHELEAAFVFSVGIDYNCYPDLLGRGPWLIQRLYRYGLEHAEAVLAQTEEQRGLLRANFGIESQLLPNLLEMPSRREHGDRGEYVLWVGSLSRRKRPEMFVELARLLPEIPFRLVGGEGEDRGVLEELTRQAEGVANLELVGFVRPDRMDEVYRGARIYVNTSRLEGLPNAFLQAWSHGVPGMTLDVDPDGVIADKDLGAVATSVDELAERVRELWSDSTRWDGCSSRSRTHVEESHDLSAIAPIAEAHLLTAIERRRDSSKSLREASP